MLKILNRCKNKKGFTLIELIVVIAILAILAAILVPSMLGILGDSKKSVADANARSVYSAAQSAYVYMTSTGEAPADSATDDPYDSTADAADPFIVQVEKNLGTGFEGVYTITVAGGVTEVTYKDNADSTTIGTYPAE